LVLFISAWLVTVLASRCPEDDLAAACDNIGLCWRELDFKSSVEMDFLCKMFDDIGGLYSERAWMEEVKPIAITESPSDRFIKPGEPAEFTCSAQNADKVSILRRGASTCGRGAAGSVKTTVEKIESVKQRDQGWITCLAVQEGGAYALARGYLTVVEVEEPREQCCRVHGDPHIQTFDGKKYNYMGSCEYILAKDLAEDWFVYGTYKACGDKTKQLSCIVSITVFYQGVKVQFLRMFRINYDGEEITVPLDSSKYIGQIKIERSAMKYFIYLGNTGVRVMWDGMITSEICLPAKCRAGVQGMCGNADCNPENEFAGFISSSAFGNKWAVGEDCDLEPEDGALSLPRKRPCNFIPYEEKVVYEARCNKILEMFVFSDCIKAAKLDRDSLLTDCMFDMCSGLTLGGGCAKQGDQRCDAEIKARIDNAVINGMSIKKAVARYTPVTLDPACLMGYNLVIQCSAWRINIDGSWTTEAGCPTEEERRKTMVCP